MRRHAPAAERNREPIIEVLRQVLTPGMRVLEVASGSGQHCVAFAQAFDDIELQPTDADEDALASIAAWRETLDSPKRDRVHPPVQLDVREQPWPVSDFDAVVCINMIHISPWEATRALMRGAASVTGARGWLYLYGPFHLDGRPTADSNARFDQSLRSRDPSWGVRDLADVQREAEQAGFALDRTVAMPANNLSVIFRKASS